MARDQSADGTYDRPFDAQDRETFKEALDTWGADAQADKAESEAAEFIVASKHYGEGKVGLDAVADELADLRIMVAQMSLIVGEDAVAQRVDEKMDQLRERLQRADSSKYDTDADHNSGDRNGT